MALKLSKKKAQMVAQRKIMKKSVMNSKCPDCGKPMSKCTCDK